MLRSTCTATSRSNLYSSVDNISLCRELAKRILPFSRQARLDIECYGVVLDGGLLLGVLVNDAVINELTTVESAFDLHIALVLTYLRLPELQLTYRSNFNVKIVPSRHKTPRFLIAWWS